MQTIETLMLTIINNHLRDAEVISSASHDEVQKEINRLIEQNKVEEDDKVSYT